MSEDKCQDSTYFIPINRFSTCLIDNLDRTTIINRYEKWEVTTRQTVYYLQKFEHHLRIKFNLSLKEYCKKYLNINWPICPVKKVDVGYKINGKGLKLSKYSKGGINKESCPAFAKSCEKMSKDRIGKNNPMFGKEAWNKGLDNSHPVIKRVSSARIGTKASDETRKKQRLARAKSPLKARHTQPHSEETIKKLRIHTAGLWATGVFQKVTSIHKKIREFLMTLPLKESFKEEFQVKYFCLDFGFPNAKIGIEADGTYFHCDPRIYPNGPIDKIQRRNYGRDKAKNKYLNKMGWTVLRFWETEINDGTFKEDLICKLKKLDLLEN